MDTLGVFAAPGTDLSGAYVNVSWSYDPSLFPAPTTALPGSVASTGINMGSISETINGITLTVNSDAYFCYFAGSLPSYVNDIFELCSGNVSSISPAPSYESDYSRLEFESYGQFLSGLGPVQNVPLTYPAIEAGVIEVTRVTFIGGIETASGETLQFAATPEPASFALFGTALLGLGAWRFRKSSHSSAR